MAAVSADGMDEACLQSAFLNEARSDRRNVRLAIAKRVRRCMHRVVPEDEILLMRSRRAEDELDIGQRFEFDRLARRLESRQVSVPQLVTHREDARCGSDPEDGVARWWLVAPALAGLRAYREVIDRRGGTRGRSMRTRSCQGGPAPDRLPAPLQGWILTLRLGPIRAPAARRSRAGSRGSDPLCRAHRRHMPRPACIHSTAPAGSVPLTLFGSIKLTAPSMA
jgi:hypothetical protein